MIRTSRCVTLAVAAVAAWLSVACGQSSFSTTGPSGVRGTSAGGALITGTVTGLTNAALAAGNGGAPSGSFTISVAGTEIVSSLDGAGRFRLSGVPSGPVVLQFKGSGLDASLTLNVASGEHVELTVRVTSNGVRIEAEQRERENGSKIEGRITTIDATARTLRVSGALIEVPASAVIKRGSRTLAFSDLQVGDDVDVRARLEGTRLIASEVVVKDGDDDDDDDDDDRDGETQVEGTVSGLTGTCPAITFTVRTVSVRTTSATRFDDVSCAAVVNGRRVEVKGMRQSDGSVVATRVKLDD